MCPCSGVSSSSSRPRPERRLTRGGASSSRGPLTARILTRHWLERIFQWKTLTGADYKESFLMLSFWIVPRKIVLKTWPCQCCYCTFLWEYLLDDLLFKWIHICPFDVYFNKNWKVSSLSSGEDQCVSTRALCMHPWGPCILFIKSSEALNRIWYLIGVHYRISTKKRKRNTES